jgi:hypothetical protein
MHSPNPSLSPQASIETTSDTNNNNLERLKQQSQHCNGTPSTNNFVSTSTQTNHSPLHTQNFTNSQKEVLRLIGQHLQSAGLSQTLESLISESGCVLEHEQASNFRELIISGKWSEAVTALDPLKEYIEEEDGIQVDHIFMKIPIHFSFLANEIFNS